MKKRSVDFSDPQEAEIAKEAEVLGISFNELVRRIIDQHIQEKRLEKRRCRINQGEGA